MNREGLCIIPEHTLAIHQRISLLLGDLIEGLEGAAESPERKSIPLIAQFRLDTLKHMARKCQEELSK